MLNGYPEDHELDKLKTWKIECVLDLHLVMQYVRDRWDADKGYFSKGYKYYRLSTGGWSGNESLIYALRANPMFWAMFWFSSERGGHYVFEIRKGGE